MSIYLKDILSSIKELDKDAMEMSQKRWNSIAKPLNSLGLLEEVVIKMAGITRNPNIDIKKRAVVVMCADNGVVEEGVTQTGQEVTAIVAENMVKGDTSVDNMAKCANVDVIPVDIGIARDMHIDGLIENKLMYGTNNMTKEPAMAKDTAIEAIECGIRIVKDLKDKIQNWDEVQAYIKETSKKSEFERQELVKEKSGCILKGITAINPVNGNEVPVYIGDFVLANYGTGAVMAVPAHDQRDYDFAKQRNIPIIQVIEGDISSCAFEKQSYLGTGAKLINSQEFSGLTVEEAKTAITFSLLYRLFN